MKSKAHHNALASAAVFNWLVALALFVNAPVLFHLFGVTPAPTEPLFVQLFAGLVFVFGIGYLWAARDSEANRPIILLGILGKITVFLAGLINVVTGQVSWQILLLVSVDLVYATVFVFVLRSTGQHGVPA